MRLKIQSIGVFKSMFFFVLVMLLLSASAQAQPVFDKSFSPNTIGPGSQSRLTFLIQNQAGVPATDLAFVDNLPAGMTIAEPNGVVTDCVNGLITAPTGGSTITFTDGRLAAFSNCTVTVNVTSATVGTLMNVSGDLTSSLGNSGTATADLTVDTERPGFSKSFSPSTVNFGERSTLTFSIDNTLNSRQAFSLSFTDVFPRGMIVADPPNPSTTCTGGTITAIPGAEEIRYAPAFAGDASVAIGADCSVSVDVRGNARGELENVSNNLIGVTLSSFDSGFSGDTLEVVSTGDIQLTQEFIADPVIPGASVELQFTITNLNRNFDLTNIGFTDDLDAALTGLVATGLPLNDVCGSGSSISGTSVLTVSGGNLGPEESCTFSVSLDVPVAAATGVYINTTSTPSGEITGQPTNGNTSTESLIVNQAPLLTKTFLTSAVGAGGSVAMEFTITNQSTTSAATDITFNDNINGFLSGATISNLPAAGFCGAGSNAFTFFDIGQLSLSVIGANLPPSGSCTFQVGLQLANSTSANVYTNTTTTISAVVDGITQFGNNASADLTVVAGPRLSKEFTDDPVAPGDTVTISYTITNNDKGAVFDATDITFSDDFNAVIAGLSAVGLPLNDVCGVGSSISGTTNLTLTGGNLSAGQSCTFDVTLQVPAAAVPGLFNSFSSTVTAMVNGLSTISDGADDVLAISGLSFSHEFIDDPVVPGQTALLEYTIANDSISDASGMFFTHSLSNVVAGLSTNGVLPTNPCGVGSTLSGTNFLILVGANLFAGESCTFQVEVLVPGGANDGDYNSVTSSLTATFGGSTIVVAPSSDTLSVSSEIIDFNKSYLDDPVLPGQNVALEFTLTNLSQTDTVTGISFTDDLEASLSGLVSLGLPLMDVCGAGSTITGSGLITLTGASLAAGGNCSFTVTVQVPLTAQGGSYTNVTSTVTGTLGGSSVNGTPAVDDLLVDQLSFSKQFTGPADASRTTTLQYSISNNTPNTVTGLRFTDNLSTALPGLRVEGMLPADACGTGSQLAGFSQLELTGGQLAAGESCSFDLTVRIPSTALAGEYNSTTSPLFTGAQVISQPVQDDLIVRGEWAFRQSTVAEYLFESTLKNFIPNSPDLFYGDPNTLVYEDTMIAGEEKTVFRFASGQGLTLFFPNAVLEQEYSIVMLFALDSISGFSKLIDYAELQQDAGFYNNNGFLVYKNEANAMNSLFTPNNYFQLAVTRSASGELTAYLNGIEQFSFTDVNNTTVPGDAFNFFIDDMVTNGLENTAGSVARITVLDKLLLPEEVDDFIPLPDIIFLNVFDD
ncbi:hypothetical protein [Marinicella sp. W31]|uniref:DUF7933 domain-containing protein n=1 Tax=Marinicella sp. W31 TaxID=3023713 RepID=UPI003757E08E